MSVQLVDNRSQRKVNFSDIAVGEFFISDNDLYFRIEDIVIINGKYNTIKVNTGSHHCCVPTNPVEPVDVDLYIYDKDGKIGGVKHVR